MQTHSKREGFGARAASGARLLVALFIASLIGAACGPRGPIKFVTTDLLPPRPGGAVREASVSPGSSCDDDSVCRSPSGSAVVPSCATRSTSTTCNTSTHQCEWGLGAGCACYEGQARYCQVQGAATCAPPNVDGCGIVECKGTAGATDWTWATTCQSLTSFCGTVNQACCNGSCLSGLGCQSGTCQRCGAEGQACCAADACNGGLSCNAAKCVATPAPVSAKLWTVDPHGGPVVQYGISGMPCTGSASPATSNNAAAITAEDGTRITLQAAGDFNWEMTNLPNGTTIEAALSGSVITAYKVHKITRHHQTYDGAVGRLKAEGNHLFLERDGEARLEFAPGTRYDKALHWAQGCMGGYRHWVAGTMQGPNLMLLEDWSVIYPPRAPQ